jgi:hypothetical protein
VESTVFLSVFDAWRAEERVRVKQHIEVDTQFMTLPP